MALADVQAALERWHPPRNDTVVQPPAITWDNWADFFQAHQRFAGVVITPQTALKVAAVYACVRILAGVIASLPLPIYERDGDDRRSVKHPLWWLLNEQPNERLTATSFWEYVLACRLLYGDGLAVIRRNNNNVVEALVAVDSRDVTVRTIKVGRFKYQQIYAVNDGTDTVGVAAHDMLHFPGLGFNGERSLSVIQHAAHNAIGIAIAGDQHSGNALAAGLTSRVALEAPAGTKFTDEQIEDLRKQFVERYGMSPSGGPNSALPLILTNGLKANALTINATDAQLIESRKFQVVDIARAFGVPPFMIGETEKSTSWGSGLEQQVLGFVKFTLQPILRCIEQEINRKIWPVRERFFTEFNVNGLLRGDAKSRAEFYRAALGGAQGDGWMGVDEVRKFENMPPASESDDLYKAARNSDATQGNDKGAGAAPSETKEPAADEPAEDQ